jgi:hypothetical protein
MCVTNVKVTTTRGNSINGTGRQASAGQWEDDRTRNPSNPQGSTQRMVWEIKLDRGYRIELVP